MSDSAFSAVPRDPWERQALLDWEERRRREEGMRRAMERDREELWRISTSPPYPTKGIREHP